MLKASELIEQLNNLINQHGNFYIGLRDLVEGNDWWATGIIVEPQKDYGLSRNPVTHNYDIPEIYDSFVIE